MDLNVSLLDDEKHSSLCAGACHILAKVCHNLCLLPTRVPFRQVCFSTFQWQRRRLLPSDPTQQCWSVLLHCWDPLSPSSRPAWILQQRSWLWDPCEEFAVFPIILPSIIPLPLRPPSTTTCPTAPSTGGSTGSSGSSPGSGAAGGTTRWHHSYIATLLYLLLYTRTPTWRLTRRTVMAA